MDEILMTPDVCMKFIIWSYYYHDILPQVDMSYDSLGRFSHADAQRLDQLKDTLFKCFEPASVLNACHQLQTAKQTGEPCPFTQAALDMAFATEKKK